MKRAILVLAGTLIFLGTLSAQAGNTNTSKWTLSTTPSFIMPLTAGDFSPNMLFSSAWGGSICAEYSLPIAIPLALRLGVGYSTGGFLSASNMDVPGSLGETTVLAGASYTKPLPTDFPFVVLLMQGQPTAAFRPEQALPMQRFRPAWESPLP